MFNFSHFQSGRSFEDVVTILWELKITSLHRPQGDSSTAPTHFDHDKSPKVIVMIVIEQAQSLPTVLHLSPWIQSAASTRVCVCVCALVSNLIVPPCGFGEIHCGLCVCIAFVCTCESVCCGCPGYPMWHRKDGICSSSDFCGSDAARARVCVFTHLFLVCAFACVCLCACKGGSKLGLKEEMRVSWQEVLLWEKKNLKQMCNCQNLS